MDTAYYTARIGAEHADWLANTHDAGVTFEDLGDGTLRFDMRAMRWLRTRRVTDDGSVTDDDNGLRMWIGGDPYPIVDPIRVAHDAVEVLRSRAASITYSLGLADAVRAGAMRDLGDLAVDQAAHNAAHPYLKLDLTEVAQLVGLSRPTVYQARDARDPEQSSAAVAARALGHGIGSGNGDDEAELLRRYPGLQGWVRVLAWLRTEGPEAAWQAEHPDEEISIESLEELRPLPGYAEVYARYKAAIQQLADGVV